jgi:hypothetical protein
MWTDYLLGLGPGAGLFSLRKQTLIELDDARLMVTIAIINIVDCNTLRQIR